MGRRRPMEHMGLGYMAGLGVILLPRAVGLLMLDLSRLGKFDSVLTRGVLPTFVAEYRSVFARCHGLLFPYVASFTKDV